MEVRCEYTELVPTDSLKHHKKNRNTHSDDQVNRLAKILEFQGWRHPILVSKLSGCIVAGHGRHLAAQKLGLESVPVDYQDFPDSDAEYLFIQSDNAIASWAELDLSAINNDLPDMGPFDIDLLGIQGFEVEPADRMGADGNEDEAPEPPEEPKSKLGQIYKLGRHRLMCGDATKDIEELLDGAKIDMVYTDPPYGMNLDTDYTKMPVAPNGVAPLKHKPIIGDDSEYDASVILEKFSGVDEIYLWGGDYYCWSLPRGGSWLVWDKRCEEKFDRMIGSAFELCWSKTKHKREIARFNNTLFSGEAEAKNKVHPTQKPTKLIEWTLERVKGQNVADLYGGSGSTLIACEKTNRTCYMMEIEPKYVDVIIERWQNYTGKKAELIKDV